MHKSPRQRHKNAGVSVTRLEKSYRFDQELASLLTHFQYHKDGINLTSEEDRSLPQTAVSTPTEGLAAVLNSESSLAFLVHDEASSKTVNELEVGIAKAVIQALGYQVSASTDSEGTDPSTKSQSSQSTQPRGSVTGGETGQSGESEADDKLSVGVVTPHNAQRGLLDAHHPDDITTDTVERFQGGQRDVMLVSATVSNPEFAHREDTFILDPRRLLVAISRAKIKTIVICSRKLFQVAPTDSEHLDRGLIWNRLFLLAAGQDPSPTWKDTILKFTGSSDLDTTATDPTNVTLEVYNSTIPR